MASGAGRKRVWVVLPDPLVTRLFFETSLMPGLRERLGSQLEVVFPVLREKAVEWADTDGLSLTTWEDLFPAEVPLPERVRRRADAWLEDSLGFFPIAIRFNYRHGFHVERMADGHGNPFLNLSRQDPLPRWAWLDRAMIRWYYSARRYVSSTLRSRMEAECGVLVVANMQTPVVTPILNAARRLGVHSIGYVASWDHAVGKGAISSHLDRYIVQNAVMRADLEQYHGVDPARVVITGWPQSDIFHARRGREEWEAFVAERGLDPSRPVVLVMGNTPTNSPFEPRFFERLVRWWEESGAAGRFSLLFRPHPRDRIWRERFASGIGRPGAYVQSTDEADLRNLALMLQHGACVVSNAGTILLDALVNDRPAVCVLYDEGAPGEEGLAVKNVLGAHYRELMSSTAFYRAHRFEDVTESIERALRDPGELAPERERVAQEVVGVLDGRAGERAVDTVVDAAARFS